MIFSFKKRWPFDFVEKEVSWRALLSLGLCVTLIAVATQLGHPAKDYDGYLQYARDWLRYGTFGHPPDDWIVPGYSALIAVFLTVFGDSYVLLGNVILFAAASFLFLRILEFSGFTLRVWNAALILFLWFANPFFIFIQTKLVSENGFIPAFMAFAFFFMRYLRDGKLLELVWAAFFLAVAALIRPVALYSYAICFLPIVVRRKPLRHFVVGGLVFFTTLLPWGLRNLFVLGEFRLASSHVVAESLLGANNTFLLKERPDLRGNWMGIGDTIKMSADEELKKEFSHWLVLHSDNDVAGQNAMAKEYVFGFWRDHLDALPLLALDKLKWFWHFSARHPLNRAWYYDLVGAVWYLAWLPLAVFFIVKNPKDTLVLTFLSSALYFSAVAITTFGSARMRLPIEFMLIALELRALQALRSRV